MEIGPCLTEISWPGSLPGETAKHRAGRDAPFKGKETLVFLPADFRLIECGPPLMISDPPHGVRVLSHAIRVEARFGSQEIWSRFGPESRAGPPIISVRYT